MSGMGDPHDHPPDAFDDHMDASRAVVVPPNPDVSVTVEVPIAADTLSDLVRRAKREGRDLADVVAEALRAAA